jgi:hypothetical protein
MSFAKLCEIVRKEEDKKGSVLINGKPVIEMIIRDDANRGFKCGFKYISFLLAEDDANDVPGIIISEKMANNGSFTAHDIFSMPAYNDFSEAGSVLEMDACCAVWAAAGISLRESLKIRFIQSDLNLFGCHNRVMKTTQMVQDGWTDDGRRVMKEIPWFSAPGCHFQAGYRDKIINNTTQKIHDGNGADQQPVDITASYNHPRCQGCRLMTVT